jgi:hypothetical protein
MPTGKKHLLQKISSNVPIGAAGEVAKEMADSV